MDPYRSLSGSDHHEKHNMYVGVHQTPLLEKKWIVLEKQYLFWLVIINDGSNMPENFINIGLDVYKALENENPIIHFFSTSKS